MKALKHESMKTIGVLAIQGSVIEHRKSLEACGAEVREVRLPKDLDGIAGIIIPGGESTTISKLMRRFGLFELLQDKIKNGFPVWGTCAGAILLAKNIVGKNPPPSLSVMDITADRNAYGSQKDSFIADVEVTGIEEKVEAVFIRAPKLKSDGAEVIARWEDEEIALKQDNMLVTSFHPELTDKKDMHYYFISMCTP